MTMLWLQVLMCSAVIMVCGVHLSLYGDVIAEKTGLGRIWIGLVLVASVTSRPELSTGISLVSPESRVEKKALLRLGWEAAALLTAFGLNIYLFSVLHG